MMAQTLINGERINYDVFKRDIIDHAKRGCHAALEDGENIHEADDYVVSSLLAYFRTFERD
jgi:hypothetical protein